MEFKSFLAILLALQLSVGMAAPSAIGVASAKGNFRIDNAAISGNGTLFDGVMVETQRATGQLELNNGARLQLGVNSRGKVYLDRMILEQGESQFKAGAENRFGVEARTLRIVPADASTVAHVAMVGASRVHVSALAGTVQVKNASGVIVAALAAGRALEFEPQAGASAPSKMTGCVVNKDGRFFLTDETTNVTVELRGAGLEKQAGHKVEITGSQLPGVTPAEPNYNKAAQVIQVSALKSLSNKCSLPAGVAAAAGAAAGGAAAGGAAAGGAAAGAAAAGAAAGGAAAAGVSTAVVAGVVVAAAATGATIGIVKAVQDDETISR
jgi:hypothetical protein